MRRLSVAITVVIFAGVPNVAHPQSIVDHLIIRQDLNTKNNVPQPAFFTVTFPDGKDAIVSAGVGIVYNWIDGDTLTVGPSLEYLKDTTVSKPVDSLKLGATSEWQTSKIDVIRGQDRSSVVTSKVAYTRDGVKGTDGIQALVTGTYLVVGMHNAWLPNNEHLFHPQLSMLYSPSIGLELDHQGAATGVDPGQAIRLVLGLTLTAYPLRQLLAQHLDLTATIADRSDLQKSFTSYDGRQHALFTLTSTFNIFKQPKRTAGIGVTFMDGEDPSKGFQQQKSVQLGLRLQMMK